MQLGNVRLLRREEVDSILGELDVLWRYLVSKIMALGELGGNRGGPAAHKWVKHDVIHIRVQEDQPNR